MFSDYWSNTMDAMLVQYYVFGFVFLHSSGILS